MQPVTISLQTVVLLFRLKMAAAAANQTLLLAVVLLYSKFCQDS